MNINTFFSGTQFYTLQDFWSNNELMTYPSECPICHSDIIPDPILIGMDKNTDGEDAIIIFKCPKADCRELFISKYNYQSALPKNIYEFIESFPIIPREKNFGMEIEILSNDFGTIYNQAKHAEDIGLDQICGVGYRKALEYLIKDYIISLDSTKADEVKNKLLSKCIKGYITDEKIKFCAERAAWLGNDETHYVRKWDDKDIDDLKQLIELTINFIKNEIIMQKYRASMPDGKK